MQQVQRRTAMLAELIYKNIDIDKNNQDRNETFKGEVY